MSKLELQEKPTSSLPRQEMLDASAQEIHAQLEELRRDLRLYAERVGLLTNCVS